MNRCCFSPLSLAALLPALLAACALQASAQQASAQQCTGGYRIAAVRRDSILQRTFATLISCEHPEWPAITVGVADTAAARSSATFAAATLAPPVHAASELLVRAGDEVHAWSRQGPVRIELTAIAQESGALGALIHARVRGASSDSTAPPQELLATVRGRGDVEMQR